MTHTVITFVVLLVGLLVTTFFHYSLGNPTSYDGKSKVNERIRHGIVAHQNQDAHHLRNHLNTDTTTTHFQTSNKAETSSYYYYYYGSSDAIITVNDVTDTIVADVSNCYPQSTISCNLRSAWLTCIYLGSNTTLLPSGSNCVIELPSSSEIRMQAQNGPLSLAPSDVSIVIHGNDATISIDTSSIIQTPIGPPMFPYETGTMSNTNSATQNYKQVCITACSNQVIMFTSCGEGNNNYQDDTYFILYQGTTILTKNDDYCGYGSQVSYSIPYSLNVTTGQPACYQYCLHIGCSGSSSCSASVDAYIITGGDPRFLVYQSAASASVSESLTHTASTTKTVSTGRHTPPPRTSPSSVPSSIVLEDQNIEEVEELDEDYHHIDEEDYGEMEDYDTHYRDKHHRDRYHTGHTNEHHTGHNNGGHRHHRHSKQQYHRQRMIKKARHRQHYLDSKTQSTTINRMDTTTTTSSYYYYYGSGTSGTPSLTIQHITFQGFGYPDYPINGGTITLDGSIKAYLYSITFNGSIGIQGGSMYMNDITTYDSSSYVYIDHCTFSHSTGTNGGAIYIDEGSSYGIIITSSVFTDTIASDSGGSIYVNYLNYYVLIKQCQFTNTIAYTGDGGAIHLDTYNYYYTITGCIFSKGYCDGRGGTLSLNYGNRYGTVRSSHFIDSYSDFYGGAIQAETYNSYTTLTNNTYIRCISSSNGGAIRIGIYHTAITISNSTFTQCSSGQGGTIYYYRRNNRGIFSNLYIQHTTATGMGGGFRIYDRNNNTYFYRITIIDAIASTYGGYGGGGISIRTDNYNISVYKCTIKGGLGDMGGGILIDQRNINISVISSYFENNTALGDNGGGLGLFQSNQNFTLLGCTFINNRAMYGGGVAIDSSNTRLILSGNVFRDNYAYNSGGGLYVESNEVQFVMIDRDSLSHVTIVQTPHPYTSSLPVNGQPVTLLNKTIHVPSAEGFLVNFDPLSTIYFTDTIEIFDSNGYIVFSTSQNDFPGTTLRTLYVTGNTIRVIFLGEKQGTINYTPVTAADNYYGFKAYIYPIMTTSYALSTRNVFSNNNAVYYGGGIFIYANNLFPVIINTNFTTNSAGYGGGGMFLKNSNVGVVIQRAVFINNTSPLGDGGGIVFSSAHYGVTLRNVLWSENVAHGSGGAIVMTTGNGDGTLQDSNQMIITECQFTNNSAMTSGGALYLDNGNIVEISGNTVFSVNQAVAGIGGGVCVSKRNFLTMSQAVFDGNIAATQGGGLYASESNTLTTIYTTIFTNNLAGKLGGGMVLASYSTLQIHTDSSSSSNSKRLIFDNNIAKFGGGGMLLDSTTLYSIIDDSSPSSNYYYYYYYYYNNNDYYYNNILPIYPLTFTNNQATRGSAMFIMSLIPSNTLSITQTVFINNTASVGGTVYWLYDSNTMTLPPPGISSDTNVWSDNKVSYGIQIATQAIRILGPDMYDVTVYNQPLSPPLVYTLQDYYNQMIPLEGTSTVLAAIDDAIAAASDDTTATDDITVNQCGSNSNPYLQGSDLYNGGVPFTQGGYAIFNNLQAYCIPRGNLTIKLTAKLGSLLGISSNQA